MRDSSPAAGERLAAPPAALSLHFTEGVDLLDGAITLLDGVGTQIDIGEPAADGSHVTVDVPTLPDGGYVVDWKVVSADGHPIAGAFTFSVGDASLPDTRALGVSDDGSSAGSGLAAWRALTYGGWALVLGEWAFVLACWPGGRRDRVVLALMAGGAVMALVAGVLRVVAEASALDASLGELLELRSGRAWLALVLLAAAACGAGPMLRSGARPRVLGGGWLVVTAVVGVAIAFAGHGASGRVAVGGMALTVVHVGAASVWIGGLAGLARCLTHAESSTAAGAARRFSSLALVSVMTLAGTGACQALRELDGFAAVTESDYGRALLVKLALVAVVLVGAWFSRRSLRRRSGTQGLRRTVALELGVAAAVFAATGWLAGASPNASAEPAGPISITAADTTGAATATIEIDPGSAGPSEIHVTIERPDAKRADEVHLLLAPVDGRIATLELFPDVEGDHAMADAVEIPYPGAWTLTVHARYGDFELLTFEAPVTVR